MQNVKLLLATVAGSIALIVGVVWFFSATAAPTVDPTGANSVMVDAALLEMGARNRKGPEDAAFTVVEFADFQCPACATVAPLVDALLVQFPDDVEIVHRHFPLMNIHPNALPAAKAAEAAGQMGKFWEMHDQLFATQSQWQGRRDAEEMFAGYAEELGLDRAEFVTRMQSPEVESAVQGDLRLAETINLSGTPTLFLNGEMVNPQDIAQRILDAKLSAAEPNEGGDPAGSSSAQTPAVTEAMESEETQE